MSTQPSEIARRVDCGPDGCTLDWLVSERIEVDDDPVEFMKLATDAGWGDGLPLIPPTEARVRAFVAASGHFPDEVIAEIAPRNGRATVEKIAVNAVMAGAPPESMPLLIASVQAMADPLLNAFALNTTTCCVVPALIVSGPVRLELKLPMGPGCFGGEAGSGASIGRASRLIIRNIGGQRVGVNSKSVFGQPGRVSGICVAEWEERSPWPSFGERRGVTGSAVTVHGGATGTIDIADIVADNGVDLLEIIGKSLAFPGTNAFLGTHHGAEIMIAIAPPWADLIAAAYPDITDVQAQLYEHAKLPISWWPEPHQRRQHDDRRVDAQGNVHLVESPEHMLVIVNGGLGNLHALALHSFGPSRAVTVRSEQMRIIAQLGATSAHADLVQKAVPGVELIEFTNDGPPAGLHADVFFGGYLGWDKILEWLAASGVRWVQLSGTGIDNVPAAVFDGRIVTCARGASAVPISEWVMAAILSWAKRMPETFVHEPPQYWNFPNPPLDRVEGSTVTLVGLGGIGSAVATRALAFGMHVRALRRTSAPSPVAGVEIVTSLERLLPGADHVVLAAPSTPRTKYLLDADAFGLMKPGVHVVNIARGALIDQDALLAALDDGTVARATLDTVTPEPLPEGHWLYTHPKVRIAAHISWYTPELQQAAVEIFVENLKRFANGEPLLHVVDADEGY